MSVKVICFFKHLNIQNIQCMKEAKWKASQKFIFFVTDLAIFLKNSVTVFFCFVLFFVVFFFFGGGGGGGGCDVIYLLHMNFIFGEYFG